MKGNRSSSKSTLALFGGEPVSRRPVQVPPYPPVSKATARKLANVYLSRRWSFNGPIEQQFAREYAAYHGAKHGIFMANGTVTLQCGLAACGVGRGDEVIVPALTWIATAMAPYYLGAKPVFVDIEPTTMCLDPAKFAAAITRRTRAVIPVHLYGGLADLDSILRIARKHKLAVIEDCAHMQGGKWRGRGVGSWGDVGSFSFQQSKTLPCGEGGICLTNDDKLADKLYRLKHIGYAANTTQGQAASGPEPGLICYNYRATDFQAVILRDDLPNLRDRIAGYNRSADRLARHLKGIPGIHVQARGKQASPQGYYAWMVMLDEGPAAQVPLARLREALAAEGAPVFTGTYGPVYKHMLWNLRPGEYRIDGGSCPVSEDLATKRAIGVMHYLLGADKATIDVIGQALAKVLRNAAALL